MNIYFTGWDYNAKPASLLINGGNVMFNIGFPNKFYSF